MTSAEDDDGLGLQFGGILSLNMEFSEEKEFGNCACESQLISAIATGRLAQALANSAATLRGGSKLAATCCVR